MKTPDRRQSSKATPIGRTPGMIMLASVFILAIGCTDTDSRRVEELERDLEEAQQLSEYLHLNLVALGQAANPVKEDSTVCHESIWSLVRREVGTTCDDFAAEISAWSEKCVTECDQPARLREANDAAERECVAFCAQKNCPGPQYLPSQACAISDCYAGNSTCTQQWPLLDYCSSIFDNEVLNCVCLEA